MFLGICVGNEIPMSGMEIDNIGATSELIQTATGIQVTYHTPEEIRSYVEENGATVEDSLTFEVNPNTTVPYAAGSLSKTTQDAALHMLNQIRYIAGVPDNVTISDDMNQKCQAAALLNYVNDELSHTPEQPVDMEDSLYALGKSGAGSSNIAWSSQKEYSLNQFLVSSWMKDSDASNISRVGHRRWLLNPKMSQTGFGSVTGTNGTYSVVYALDRGNSQGNQYGVVWPAQSMPVEYFGAEYPWSVSVGSTVDESAVKVELTRRADQKVWEFSKDSSDGEFYVNNGGYGQTGCIIFRPKQSSIQGYQSGDIFDVKITGLTSGAITYSVQFFNLKEENFENGTEDNTEDSTDVENSGETGEVFWKYDASKKKLTIFGNGKMQDYHNKSYYQGEIITDVPWEAYMDDIKIVVLSDDITYIGDAAFADFPNLEEIVWPEKLTEIGDSAFARAVSLTEANIPDSVTEIGSAAFAGCSMLETIELPKYISRLEQSVFSGCSSLEEITLPEGVTAIGSMAFNCCRKLSEVLLPSTLETIGMGAFFSCKSLQEIQIPESVTSIMDQAFENCTLLTQIYIYSKWVEFSDDSVFEGDVPDRMFYCYKNSAPHSYFDEQGIDYSLLNEQDKSWRVEISGTVGIYDGKNHTINVTVPELKEDSYKVYYSLSDTLYKDGHYQFSKSPVNIINAGKKLVYYYIDAAGYAIYADSVEISLEKAKPNLAFEESTIEKMVDEKPFACKLIKNTDGSISYSSSDEKVAEVDENGTVTIHGVGTCNIIASASEGDNYLSGNAVCVLNVINEDVSQGNNSGDSSENNTEENDISWTLDEDGLLIVSGKGILNGSDIPWEEHENDIKSVIIKNGITGIGDYAFYYAVNLKHVYFPSTLVSIGEEAFGKTSLYEVCLPEGVKSIGAGAFSYTLGYADGDEEVILPQGLEYVGERAFYRCQLDAISVPDSVTEIGDNAFTYIEKVKCQEGSYAQQYAEEKGCVYEIVSDAGRKTVMFGKCGETLTWRYEEETGKLVISGNGDMDFYDRDLPEWYPLRNGITEVIVEEGCTSIEDLAFYNLVNVKQITLPDSLKESGENIPSEDENTQNPSEDENYTYKVLSDDTVEITKYEEQEGITDIEIPTKLGGKCVTSIRTEAFRDCSNLTSVTIPEGVINIGSRAFYGCSNLENITIPSSVNYIERYAFDGTAWIENMKMKNPWVVVNGILIAVDNSISGILEIPSNVTTVATIPSGATSVKITNNVTGILWQAFADCKDLTKIEITSNLTYIGGEAFLNCLNLKDVIFTGTELQWKTIEIEAGNEALTEANIHFIDDNTNGEDENTIDDGSKQEINSNVDNTVKIERSFDDSSRVRITLSSTEVAYTGLELKPEVKVSYDGAVLREGQDYTLAYMNNVNVGVAKAVVTGIGRYSGSLSREFKIVLRKGMTLLFEKNKYFVTGTGEVAFAKVKNKAKKIEIPATIIVGEKKLNVTSIQKKAFYNSNVTSVSIGTNIKLIDEAAFANCKSLSKVTIPSKVSKIGKKAFYNCKKLKNITVKTKKLTLKNVGSKAFYGIPAKAIINIPKSKTKLYKKLFRAKGANSKVKYCS